MRRVRPLLSHSLTRFALVVVSAAVLLLPDVSHAGVAALSTTTPNVYTDPIGDNGAAPDVQKVTLTDGGDGTIAVEIELAATIPDDGSTLVFGIDADRNPKTGDELGFEYAVIVRASGLGLAKWDGSQYGNFDHTSLSPNLVGGRLTFTLTLADLGSIASFDFGVITGDAAGKDVDAAPDHGVFTFPQTAALPTIQSILINLGALLPKAGKIMAIPSVQVKLSTNQIVAADSVTCMLTYKSVVVHPVGSCAWKIPKSYRKKHLVLKVDAGYQGATATLTLPVMPR